MRHRRLAILLTFFVAIPVVITLHAANAGVTLIGIGFVPGTASDESGLAGQPICQADNPLNCIDQATLGGFGSAVAYTGFNNVFLTVPDRGPFDGRTNVPYGDRFHFMRITTKVGAAFPNVTTTLLDTRFMKAGRKDLVGASSAFDTRFDPEGVSVGLLGTFFVSDEYGPYISEFLPSGHLLRRIRVPAARCAFVVPLAVPESARWNARPVNGNEVIVCGPRSESYACDPAGTMFAIISVGRSSAIGALGSAFLDGSPSDGTVVPRARDARDLQQRLAKLSEAEQAYRRALKLYEKLDRDFPEEPEPVREMAVLHTDLGVLQQLTARPREGRLQL